jgi:hypothetical protein
MRESLKHAVPLCIQCCIQYSHRNPTHTCTAAHTHQSTSSINITPDQASRSASPCSPPRHRSTLGQDAGGLLQGPGGASAGQSV